MCGIFGIVNHPKAIELTARGLHALQHRGQESWGIAAISWKRQKLISQKHMGLVYLGSSYENLESYDSAIGHVRYSTNIPSTVDNAQPFLNYVEDVAIVHNGHIHNYKELRKQWTGRGYEFETDSDSELFVTAYNQSFTWQDYLANLNEFEGGYATLEINTYSVKAMVDPHGLRPLVYGRLDDAIVFASETCALDAVGATYLYHMQPNQIITVPHIQTDDDHIEFDPILTNHNGYRQIRKAHCAFEDIYLARPDSKNVHGQTYHQLRYLCGNALAAEEVQHNFQVTNTKVVGVPDSGNPAALGYAQAFGLYYFPAIIKNRHSLRTFIEPTQETREFKVGLKYSVLDDIRGNTIILVDDSLIRGTTAKHLVRLLREKGAKEVHLRIASPPALYPDKYGIDIREEDLFMKGKDINTAAIELGVDSLRFLSLRSLNRVLDYKNNGEHLATHVFDGDYIDS